jgi:hypothetical protein
VLDNELIKVAQDAGVGIIALLVTGLALFGIIQLISLLKQRSKSEESESSRFLDLLSLQIKQFENISTGLEGVVMVAQETIKIAQEADKRNQERFEMSIKIMGKVHEQRNAEILGLPDQTREALQPLVESVRVGLEKHLNGIVVKLEELEKKINTLPQAETVETIQTEIHALCQEFDAFKIKIETVIQALERDGEGSNQKEIGLVAGDALPAP